jgi:hypothetical protein
MEKKHTRKGPNVSGLAYKCRAKEKMLRGIRSAIYGEVNVSVSGGCVLQYGGGTRSGSCFISATLKRWSGRKLLDCTTYLLIHIAMTGDRNVITRGAEKILEYKDCTIEIERMWTVNTKVIGRLEPSANG